MAVVSHDNKVQFTGRDWAENGDPRREVAVILRGVRMSVLHLQSLIPATRMVEMLKVVQSCETSSNIPCTQGVSVSQIHIICRQLKSEVECEYRIEG